MISIYGWLRTYFYYEEDFHPVFEKSLQKKRSHKDPAHVNPEYSYPELEWTGRLGLDYADKAYRHMVLYVPDKQIHKNSEKTLEELIKLPETNYSLYGLYMNLIAHLEGYHKVKLELIQACVPQQSHIIGYRTDIAQYLIDFRRAEIIAEKEKEKKASQVSQAAGLEKDHSFFSELF